MGDTGCVWVLGAEVGFFAEWSKKCDRFPLSFQLTECRFGAGKTGGLHLSVKQRIRTRSQSHKWKGTEGRTYLQLLWLPCLLSKYKVWPTMQHSTIRKTLIMPTRTGFLPGTTPWTMPWHCSGRCQELSSMDNCGTVLKHALGPFWFMLIVTFIKADSNLKDDGHWLFQAVLRRNRILR